MCPVTPMRLLRIPEPFDHPDFIFEPKLDGLRALAHARGHRCELVSRNGHTFKSWCRQTAARRIGTLLQAADGRLR
jgi:ATP-dependent DNA ligase